uniref:Uncharacterized protein n=1 Tax=Tanacetum cinerariifolium TaxID=118510 RepID=A0A6L2L2G8_TANCI|nr:hypothetical protein [Tanacetum cinerariifolium]
MINSKSFNRSPKYRDLYHAHMELILEDEDAMDKGVADKLKKRKPDDADKDEGLSYSSKGKNPATSSKSSKSGKSTKDQVVELISMQDSNNAEHDDADYADMPMDQGEDLGRQIVPANSFFNNNLEYLRGGRNDKKYTASMTKSKTARYELKGIEDMARVDDLQLGVESYQKKLNLTKPKTRKVDMSHRLAYITFSNHQGVIYEDNLKLKRFMRADELHKFSDDTLIFVHDTLSQMLHDLHLRYNKTTRIRQWTSLDQQRTHFMIKAINQKLLDKRLMRSLEKFIGGRDYREDLILLQWTI